MVSGALDAVMFGQRLRHLRRERKLTLAELAVRVNKGEPFLSMLENGKREPRLSLVNALAAALAVPVGELLSSEPPSHRAALELELEKVQQESLYRELHLPPLTLSARIPDAVLEHILGLYGQLKFRSTVGSGTPTEVRRVNVALREEMRRRDNYLGEIEQVAQQVLTAAGYPGSGALSQRLLDGIAAYFGFSVHAASDLPRSIRAICDLRHKRIFMPEHAALPARIARLLVLETLGQFALSHVEPSTAEVFRRQQLEATYFAGAMLAPEQAATALLQQSKRERDLSLEDLRETFDLSYEIAADRFTNLATRHLGIRTHFVRSDEEGTMWRVYENDGMPIPRDPDRAIEGVTLCRQWDARRAFGSADRPAPSYQYLDTPADTFWNVTYTETHPYYGRPSAVTVGVQFDDARLFRGRNTENRAQSRCPDGDCCRRPPPDVIRRWNGHIYQVLRNNHAVVAAPPAGTFSVVDMSVIYEFLERQPL